MHLCRLKSERSFFEGGQKVNVHFLGNQKVNLKSERSLFGVQKVNVHFFCRLKSCFVVLNVMFVVLNAFFLVLKVNVHFLRGSESERSLFR